MDSVSRVQCSPEEMYRNRPEKGQLNCREIHAPRKAGDPKLVNNSRDAHSQDRTESSKLENEQRVQQILQGKAEHRGTAECSRRVGEQVSQQQEGTSADLPLRFLFQRKRNIKKRCSPSKAAFTQTSDGEGKGHREANSGPTFVGPTSTEEGIGFTRGEKAHLMGETSIQGMLAPRENRRKLQHLSQLRFYTLPRNRKKLSMMRGGRRIPVGKNKKGRSTDLSESLSSRQLQTDNNGEGASIGDSDIADMNNVIHTFLIKQVKETGRDCEDAEEIESEWQRRMKTKMLMSWLPLLCRASNGSDSPILSSSERAELEKLLEETIETLDHQEAKEKVLLEGDLHGRHGLLLKSQVIELSKVKGDLYKLRMLGRGLLGEQVYVLQGSPLLPSSDQLECSLVEDRASN
ncbi:hypothetical protein Ancab_017492 [Ancistrocladus abbreviatus]